MQKWLAIGSAILLAACLAAPLQAQSKDDSDDQKTTLEALKQRLAEQDRLIKEQNQRLGQLEEASRSAATQPSQLSEAQRKAVKDVFEEMKADADKRSAPPTWLEGLVFAGDFRLRYEDQWFSRSTEKKLTPYQYDRLRYRLRFGFIKTISDEWSTGFRLETGNGTDPWESNQTMTGDFVRNSIFVDQAWVQYKPKCLNGDLSVIAGRFVPQLIGTDMTIDPDVTFSGVAEIWNHQCDKNLNVFANMDQTFLEENRTSGLDSNGEQTALFNYQAGAHVGVAPGVTWTPAFMLWQYANINHDATMGTDEAAGQSNNIPLGNSLVTRNGSTYLAAKDFDLLDIYNELVICLGEKKTPLRFFTDEVYNCEDKAVGKYKGQDFGAIAGVSLGKINWKKGDWEVGYNYRYIEADSMIADFSENGFWGTDKKGSSIAGKYCIADNVSVNARFVQFDWITDTADPERYMLRLELEARF
jgi:hypothetical protein